MTYQVFLNYSSSMDNDLIALEKKLTQLIELCNSVRAENANLRQELVTAKAEISTLKQNMATAGARINALIERLPEIDALKETQ